MPSEGTFILADIGGYTGFLTGVGIEHGVEITSHLLNALLKCNRGRWKLGNIEGDCIFFYRQGREPPEELLAHVRALYEDFRDRITDIAARSSCPCGACSRTSELRLKFIVHVGQYDTQKIGGRTELIGPDIVVAHRLLKNSVPAAEYVLVTPALRDIGRPGAATTAGREDYEDVGAVDYVYVDLASMRQECEQASQVFLGEQTAKIVVKTEVDAPPEVVWEAITDTAQLLQWYKSLKRFDHVQGENGGLGEVHHCVHDDGANFIHVTVGIDREGRRVSEKVWLGGWMSRLISEMYHTWEVRALPNGRTLACYYATLVPRIPMVSDVFLAIAMRKLRQDLQADFGGLKAYCEQNAPGDAC